MNSRDNARGPQGHPHLGDSINAATRTLHAKLNKAILQHFPLALPPHTTNPSIYATGLLHIAPIYLTFESLWHDLIDTRNNASPNSKSEPPSLNASSPQPKSHATPPSPPTPNPPPCDPRILALLQTLHHPLLTRTTPLLTDIHTLLTNQQPSTPTPTTAIVSASLAAFFPQQQQKQISRQRNGNNSHQTLPQTTTTHPNITQQAIFLARMQQSVCARPHVLLAYAWVFYMALFSGGRVLRGLLEGAGEGFWRGFEDGGGGGGVGGVVEVGDGLETKKRGLPLGFFRFETPRDGEDLKGEFKERFGEAGRVLTSEERDEVVGEAGKIFKDMILLVDELDCMLGKNQSLDRAAVTKRGGRMSIGDDELARMTGRKGAELAAGPGAWYLVGTLLALVGLWARYAWK